MRTRAFTSSIRTARANKASKYPAMVQWKKVRTFTLSNSYVLTCSYRTISRSASFSTTPKASSSSGTKTSMPGPSLAATTPKSSSTPNLSTTALSIQGTSSFRRIHSLLSLLQQHHSFQPYRSNSTGQLCAFLLSRHS